MLPDDSGAIFRESTGELSDLGARGGGRGGVGGVCAGECAGSSRPVWCSHQRATEVQLTEEAGGAMTGPGETCSNRRTLERNALQQSPALFAPSTWTSETASTSSEDQPGIITLVNEQWTTRELFRISYTMESNGECFIPSLSRCLRRTSAFECVPRSEKDRRAVPIKAMHRPLKAARRIENMTLDTPSFHGKNALS